MLRKRPQTPVVASESSGNGPVADWKTNALALVSGKSGLFLTGKQAVGWLAQGGLDITEATLRKILTEAGQDLRPGVSLDRAPGILVTYYKEMSEKVSKQKDNDIARRAASEADLAELKLGEQIGEVVSWKAAKLEMTALVVAYRERVRVLPGLSAEQRSSVMDVLKGMELPEKCPEQGA